MASTVNVNTVTWTLLMVTTPSTSPLPFCTKVTTWPVAKSIRLVVTLLMLKAKDRDC